MLSTAHNKRDILEKAEGIVLESQSHQALFHQLADKISGHNATTENELRLAKEQLSKLKFNFIELETKRRFLQYVRDNIVEFDREQKKDLEIKNNQDKIKSRQLKEVNADLKTQIINGCKDIADNHESVVSRTARLESDCKRIRALEKNILEYQKAKPETCYVGDQVFNLDNCQDILEKQVNDMIESKKKQSACETEIKELKQSIQECQSLNEQLRVQVQEKAALVEKNKESQSVEHMERLKHMNRWYDKVLLFARKFSSGDTVKMEKDCVIVESSCVNPLTTVEQSYQICIKIDIGSKRMKDAMLIPELVDIHDIKERSIKTNDFPLLVREIKYRLEKFMVIDSELEVLRDGYNISWAGNDYLRLILDSGVTIDLLLEDAKPNNQSHYYALKLFNLTGLDYPEKYFIRLQDLIAGESLEACVEAIVDMF